MSNIAEIYELKAMLDGGKALLRKSDNAFIPIADENPDYQRYLAQVADGSAIAPEGANA